MKIKSSDKLQTLACLNCTYPFTKNEKYCPNCGQKNKGSSLTFGGFIKDIFKENLSWDSKFWNTITQLLFKPGKVTKEYIAGRRNRYMNPLRAYFFLFLVTVFMMWVEGNVEKFDGLFSGTFNEKDWVKKKDTIDDDFSMVILGDTLNFGKKKKTNPKKEWFVQNRKDSKGAFQYVFEEKVRLLEEDPHKYMEGLQSKFAFILLITLLLSSLILKFLYIRRGYSYVHHVIFVVHTQAGLFILYIILSCFEYLNLMDENDYFLFDLIVLLIYSLIAVKQFYGQGWGKTIFKFIIFNLFNCVFFLISLSIFSVLEMFL